MTLRNTASAYGSIAKLLHWTIVVLIIAQFWLGYSADDLPNGLAKLKLLATHKSIGMTVLMLALVRVVWRLANPVPPPPVTTPRWQQLAARTSHLLLYLLLFLQPVTGWIMILIQPFGRLSIEDLANVDISSVAKTTQPLSDAASRRNGQYAAATPDSGWPRFVVADRNEP